MILDSDKRNSSYDISKYTCCYCYYFKTKTHDEHQRLINKKKKDIKKIKRIEKPQDKSQPQYQKNKSKTKKNKNNYFKTIKMK